MPNLISRIYNFVNDKNNGIPITSSRVDAELNQLVNTMNQSVIIQPTAPSSPINGQIWFDSTNSILKEYRFNEWVLLGPVQTGTVMATPETGDIWIDNSGSEIVLNVRNKDNNAWISFIQPTNNFLIPTGAILEWPTSSAPTGFLLCDGSAVSRTTYTTLFSLIGTTFGIGDGSTTFNLPDRRGNVAAGYKSGDANFGTLGAAVGEATHVLTIPEMPAHTHTYANQGAGGSGISGGTSGSSTTGSTGGGGGHNNIQPSLTMNFIIKT